MTDKTTPAKNAVTVTLVDGDPESFESNGNASIESSEAGDLLVQTSDSVAIFARGRWVSARVTKVAPTEDDL